jgi:hypothetical protein
MLFQFRAQLFKCRVEVDPHMRGAKGVVLESGQSQFTGQATAAHPFITFRNQHTQAFAHQHGGANQPVVAAPGNNDVVVSHKY